MASDEQPEPVTPKNLEHLFAGLTGSESDEVVDEKKEPQPKPEQSNDAKSMVFQITHPVNERTENQFSRGDN